MATNGEASFAIFFYTEVDRAISVVSEGIAAIGFDAGDRGRSDSVLPNIPLERVNVFRIDGINIPVIVIVILCWYK